jgi:mannitol-specific phosphotransferase system IIBC component
MSADPVTLAVASFAVSAVGTYQQVRAQKAANKAQIQNYESEKKANQLKGLQDANDVMEEAARKRKQNLAIVAGSGYSDDSRSFLAIQSEVNRIAQRDINNIRINTLRGEGKLESAIYTTKVMGKAQEYGAYASIAAAGFKTASYASSYKARGQYDNYYDPLDPGQTE